MNRKVFLVIGFLINAQSALAQAPPGNFSTGSSLTVNPDLVSGATYGWANITGAVTTSLESDVSYALNPAQGRATLTAHCTARGVWGNPSLPNPYYDFLEYPGLQTTASLHLTDVIWNGQTYQFDAEVVLWLSGYAHLTRSSNPASLTGVFTNSSNSQLAIPTTVTSWVEVYAPGHPAWLPDWELKTTSEYLVMVAYQPRPTPEPTTALLLWCGGLALIGRVRRRL
jgi:hypothetical protein